MNFGIIITSLILCLPLSGQSLLENVQNKFESVFTLKCGFKQTTSTLYQDQEFSISGKLFFKKTDNHRIESGDRIIITGEQTTWNYDSAGDKVIITDYDDDPLSFSLSRFVLEFPEECDVEEENNQLTLFPHDENLGVDYIKLLVNDDFLVTEFEIKDFNESVYKFVLSDILLNIDLKDSLFIFTPGGGTKVIDLR